MTNLTDRAERALLGALLTKPPLIPRIPALEPGDFARPEHQRIFQAVVPRPGDYTGWAAGPSPGATFARARAAADPVYLKELQQACPEPAHAAAYARMVIEAGLRRQLAAHAIRLEYQAATLHGDLLRLEKLDRHGLDLGGRRNGRTTAQQALGFEMELAIALRQHARAFDPGRALPEQGDDAAVTLHGSTAISSATAAWQVTAGPARPPLDEQAQREEQVLAGIIQRRDGTAAILESLPAAAFTDQARRHIYLTIAGLHARGEPFDPVIIDWELTRQQAAATVLGQVPAHGLASEPGYISRLARLPADTPGVTGACHAMFRNYRSSQPEPAQQLTSPARRNGHPGSRSPRPPILLIPPIALRDPGNEPRM